LAIVMVLSLLQATAKMCFTLNFHVFL